MLRPSCSLEDLPLSTLQPLTALRSLHLPSAPCWLLCHQCCLALMRTSLRVELHVLTAAIVVMPICWLGNTAAGPATNPAKDQLAVVRRRFSNNAMAVEGLSALTQLTRYATDWAGFSFCPLLYDQLAQLTGLRELDVPTLNGDDEQRYKLPVVQHPEMHLSCCR